MSVNVIDDDTPRWRELWERVRMRVWQGHTIAGAFCQYITPGMVHVYIVFTDGGHTVQVFTLATVAGGRVQA